MVYLADGSEVEYVGKAGSFHVVCHCYDRGDGDVYVDDPIVVREIFEEPPTPRYHKQITELQQRIDEQQSLIVEKRAEVKAVCDKLTQKRAALDRLLKLEGLEVLEAAIEGRITHFAMLDDYKGPSVLSAADANCEYSAKEMRLLAVSGDKTWHLNKYRDGSGGWERVMPCTSEQEAIDCVKAEIERLLSSDKLGHWRVKRAVDAAERFGFDVPANVREFLDEERRKLAANRLAKAEKEASEARAELEEVAAL